MKLQRIEILLWALVAGTIVCVVLVNRQIFQDRPDRLRDESMVIGMQCLLAAVPFILAARATRRDQHPDGERPVTRLMLFALAAFAVTVAAWIAYLYDGINATKGNGANIGLGWLVLASPLVAGGILFAGFRLRSASAR